MRKGAMPMSRKISAVVAAAVVSVLSALPAAMAAESASKPVTELKFGPTGVTDGVHGELQAAAAYGDLAKGPHGTFIKMPTGFVSKIHTHTGDYWGVVISGVAANGKPGSAD